MNKTELITEAALKSGVTKKDTEKTLNAAIDLVIAELAKGETVKMAGFGNFVVKERPEREMRNPRTGEPVTVAASKTVQFRPAKALKDSL
jgi:DNA-binding protein HU-beta